MWQYNCSPELAHHGIKGQKWGVRRFQKKDGTLTSAGKKRYSDDVPESDISKSDEGKRGLTDKQKKAIKVGAAVAATALAVYGTYKLVQLYNGDRSLIDPETGFRMIKKNMSDEENLKAVNPGRINFLTSKYKNKEIISGSSTNCMLCTTAYDLRKRGYDVHAGLEKNGRGYMPDSLFSSIYKNYKGTTKISPGSDPASTYKNVTDFIKNSEPGSRGNIVVWWKGMGGHSMIWENVDGVPVFKDGQTNQVYKDFAKEILSHVNEARPIEMLRTDNLEIATESMKKVINSDTAFKTYVDHGSEIVANMWDEPVVQSVALGSAALASYKALNYASVKSYRKQHPNTTLSDKEILNMLSNQLKG